MHMKHAKNESKCWRYKNYIVSSFVRDKILFIFCWNSAPFFTRKTIFLYQNFLSLRPTLLFFLFISEIHQNTGKPTNMKQADKVSIKKITLYEFLFQIYIRIIPLVVFYSFWVRCYVYAPFTKIWFQKVAWDIDNLRIICNFH